MLRISTAASLALHAIILLAANCNRTLSTKKIAAKLRASEAHLSKVLQRLGKAGLVEATRGPKGGFCLARPGGDISLLEVYEAIEGPLQDSVCLLGEPVCQGEKCILGGLLETVNRQVREYLGGTTLSDLAGVYEVTQNERDQKDNQD